MHEPWHIKDHSRRRFIAGLAATVLLLTWAGCSVEKNYELLTFFFDGVPDPNAPKVGSEVLGTNTKLPILTVHAPFAKNGCPNCHTNFSNLSELRGNSNVCLTCHENVPDGHPYMHGPVAAVACLMCHNPHQSPYVHLLRKGSPDVCLQCHMPSFLTLAHPDNPSWSGQDCLRCHSGHGGAKQGFLLENPLPLENEAEPPAAEPEG